MMEISSSSFRNPFHLDLNTYISRYDGYTRIQRLFFIAENIEVLKADAIRLLHKELKTSINTSLYLKACELAKEVSGLEDIAQVDSAWVESTIKQADLRASRLEAELFAAKSTLVKESIRLGYSDLGNFSVQRGNLTEALKMFIRVRDYCSNPRQTLDMLADVMTVCIDMNQFRHLPNYFARAEAVAGWADCPRLQAASALLALHEGKIESAARQLIRLSTQLGGGGSGSGSGTGSGSGAVTGPSDVGQLGRLLSVEDIGTYSVLLGLASLSREEVKRLMLDSIQFKTFLEIVPDMRTLLQNYVSGRYQQVLSALDDLRAELKCDLHTSRLADTIVDNIRDSVVVLAFKPYCTLSLQSLASLLGLATGELENLLVSLIIKGRISARLDIEAGVLRRRKQSEREVCVKKVLDLADKQAVDLRNSLLRLSMLKHGVVVSASSDGVPGVGAVNTRVSGGRRGGTGMAGAADGDEIEEVEDTEVIHMDD